MQNRDANPQPRQHSHVLGGQVPALHDADGQHAAPGHGEGGRDGRSGQRSAAPNPRPRSPEPMCGPARRAANQRAVLDRWAGITEMGGARHREWAGPGAVRGGGIVRSVATGLGAVGTPTFLSPPNVAAGRAAAHSSAPCLRSACSHAKCSNAPKSHVPLAHSQTTLCHPSPCTQPRDTTGSPWGHHGGTIGTSEGHPGDTTRAPWGHYREGHHGDNVQTL